MEVGGELAKMGDNAGKEDRAFHPFTGVNLKLSDGVKNLKLVLLLAST